MTASAQVPQQVMEWRLLVKIYILRLRRRIRSDIGFRQQHQFEDTTPEQLSNMGLVSVLKLRANYVTGASPDW